MISSHSKRREFTEGLILDDGFLPDILEIMLEAWSLVSIHDKKTLEPRITALWQIQCCHVNQSRYFEFGSPWKIETHFDFFHEVQNNDPVTGKQISRKDIVVRLYGSIPCNSAARNAPYLVVESKKLMTSRDISEYVGENGMLCFLNGKYDPFKSHVAMAAYVMTDEIDEIKNDVLRKIKSLSDRLNIADIFTSWAILPEYPRHSTTQHLVKGMPISIHHLFLEANIEKWKQ